jgi:hypothetical protein
MATKASLVAFCFVQLVTEVGHKDALPPTLANNLSISLSRKPPMASFCLGLAHQIISSENVTAIGTVSLK